ncbi:MAG TPA: HAD family phosphatase [Conexibacter sp.]|jgi:HAD superfamily hydrolase (TIGR01509 family)
MTDAVVFDLDGVLVQSEELWDAARRQVAADAGVPWPEGATAAMMGMSSREWSRYVHETIGVPLPPEEVNAVVLAWVMARYRQAVPWIDGAREAVARMAARWPLALATSSNREIVDLVVQQAGWAKTIAVTVSSEEVAAGKPAPDVYLEAARRLGVEPAHAVAIEDSTNGLLSGAAAGLRVIAIPNPAHPPAPHSLDVAAVVLPSIEQLAPAVVDRLG